MDIRSSIKLTSTQMHRMNAADIEMATIALIDAMNYYKSYDYSFNKGWNQIVMPTGIDRLNSHPSPLGVPQVRSGMPHGLIRPIIIQVVGKVTSGNVTTGSGTFNYEGVFQEPLIQVSVDELARMNGGTGQLATQANGWPRYWAWTGNGSIRISPAPHDNLVADVFFLEDSHRPRYRYGSDVWVFEQLAVNNSSTVEFWQWVELEDSFENIWLMHAEPLIRARAKWDLLMNFYHDRSGAQVALVDLQDKEREMSHARISGLVGSISRTPSCL